MVSVDPELDDTAAIDDTAVPHDYSDESSTFGDRLVLARDALGLSQKQLADRLGVKLKTLRHWEEDRAEPRANKLVMLAGMLNVSIVWLMSGDGNLPEFADSVTETTLMDAITELRRLRADQVKVLQRMEVLEKRLEALL